MGRAAGAADDGRVAQHNAFIFNGFDGGRRDIHHQVTLAEIAGHGLDANEVGLQLRQTYLRGNIERLRGVFAADAICRKAMTGLETLQRAIDVAIEGAGNACFTRQVAGHHQSLAQRLYGMIGDADLETLLGRRHFRPAAILHDLLILHDRLLHVDRRFASENREAVTVDYLVGELALVPLWQVILVAFGAGAGLVALVALYASLRNGLVRRRYRKAIGGLEAEIHQLRNLPLAQNAAAPPGSKDA